MSIIFVLIPLAVIIVCIAIGVFFWAVKSNQFDDLERQGYSILFDDDIKKDAETQNHQDNTEFDVENDKLTKEKKDPKRSDELNERP
jgi:cbb3-type cytochrome oxidase maturation protein